MSTLIFILMLVVLIVGHEFGHFIVAKWARMRVLEFGFGFPPKLWGRKVGETEYTVNALPFGGFVRIFGEDAGEVVNDAAAFSNRSQLQQGAVIFAGPFANFILAFLLLATAFMIGVPQVIDDSAPVGSVPDAHVVIANVLVGSPAEKAGFERGDIVTTVAGSGGEVAIERPQQLVDAIALARESVEVTVTRGSVTHSFTVTPEIGIVTAEPSRKAIGVASALVGTVQYGFFDALSKSLTNTFLSGRDVLLGLLTLLTGAFTLTADLSGVAGPVGIVSLVGEASMFGVGSLLSLASIISINLAIINLLPFPALDGGRLAMLIVEGVTRRKIPLRVSSAINYIGFVVLIALMLAVTANDIVRLVT